MRRRWSPEEAGYTLVEILTVFAIISLVLLVTVPNMVRWNERYRVRSDARGVAALMKIGRMKAVSGNTAYVVELDSALKTQCPNYASGGSTLVLYRSITPTQAIECFTTHRTITVIDTDTTVPTVYFKANGMASNDAPTSLRIESRKSCQKICVNAAGAVRANELETPCDGGGTDPCS